MNAPDDSDAFYIGYLPRAAGSTRRFLRRTVVVFALAMWVGGAGLAVALPYFGAGVFEFGHARDFTGTVRRDGAPRLTAKDADYLLVGYGKHGAPAELCGAGEVNVSVRGTLIQRDGRQLLEVNQWSRGSGAATATPPSVMLGRFTLTGEIVDSKCYFGVMNPGEGVVHRACAELCLRGGVPAVFVARDRQGDTVHLLMDGGGDGSQNAALLPWIGRPVEISGIVSRRGQWLTIVPDLGSVRWAENDSRRAR